MTSRATRQKEVGHLAPVACNTSLPPFTFVAVLRGALATLRRCGASYLAVLILWAC